MKSIEWFTAFVDYFFEREDWELAFKMKWNRVAEIQGRAYGGDDAERRKRRAEVRKASTARV